MNKIIFFFISLFIGEYILDEMTKDDKVEMYPSPFRYVRDKIIFFLARKGKERHGMAGDGTAWRGFINF